MSNPSGSALAVALDCAGSERQDEQRRIWLAFELEDAVPLALNQRDDVARARIANVKPNHLRRSTLTKLRSRKSVSLETIVKSLTFE